MGASAESGLKPASGWPHTGQIRGIGSNDAKQVEQIGTRLAPVSNSPQRRQSDGKNKLVSASPTAPTQFGKRALGSIRFRTAHESTPGSKNKQ
jgi:hypothetical protein